MPYIPLLQRQIKKYFKGEIPQEFLSLLDAINRSYEHYERDHSLGIKSLEMSSKELQQLAQENEEKRERLKTILNSTSDGIFVINERGIIQDCNNAALQYFNNINVVGKHVNSVPMHYIDNAIPLADLFDQTSSKRLYELEITRNDASSIIVELSLSELFLSSEKLKICVLRDISLRKEAERIASLRHEITHILIDHSSYIESIPKILSKLCIFLKWDAAVYWKNGLTPAFIYNPNQYELELKIRSEPFYFDRETVLKVEQLPFKSVALIPVCFDNHLLGVIQLFSIKSKNEALDVKTKVEIASQIGLSIEREFIRKKENELQQELVSAAKQAGMTQVASSVLHNVGNVLNSVNISATMLQDGLVKSELNNLPKVADMIKTHKNDIAHFISQDPKGKILPDYILELNLKWLQEFELFKKEIKIIIDNIQNIKSVIKMQLSNNQSSNSIEKVTINNFINDVLILKQNELDNNKITVIKNFDTSIQCLVDKNKLSQVMVNLINNAIEATEDTSHKQITINTESTGSALLIHFTDNGIGMNLKQLENLFAYGFTTKKEGHGFGLNSSMKLIKEMGGELKATSSGLDKGATFTISLPLLSSMQLVQN